MTTKQHNVTLHALTLVLVVLSSMLLGVFMSYAVPLLSGTQPVHCLGFWAAEERHHREGLRRAEDIRRNRGEPKELIGSFSKGRSE